MKYLLILADGMADYKIEELGGQTPLQYARTPNMDILAPNSFIGAVRTIPAGYPPGSDVANLAVMGYDPRQFYTGRSPLEAASMGIELNSQDLALRCNLVTLSSERNYADKTMVDYSAGEISSAESASLIDSINRKLGNQTFAFYPGISYRHLMIWKSGADKSIELTPPHDISDRPIGIHLPQGPDGEVLLNLMTASEEIMSEHPVNQSRVERGLNPASSLWFWGEGTKPQLDSFEMKYRLKGSVVSAVDLVKGLGICAGLRPVKVEGATGGIVTNFAGKIRAALDELKAGQDFVYLHIESPDEAGHQGDLKAKIWAIEQIDQEVLGLLRAEIDGFDDLRILLLPDHPTPLQLKTHTAEPVPFLIFDKNHLYPSKLKYFNEETASNGHFIEEGHQLMDLFISNGRG
ncbi:Bisphosphoglycerate-independent phosphoglycerate mutase [Syntrophomonas zehnderi OL-4]|uniref:Bisphosphoglycerate-independent phosphoglycerate mutase n=1 Tax=Syntrophomonas zehnderi OL-4 TaxID=690567 RepID=A0A0E4GAI9_9FIRM|nr:cofactor-independent phosphoglycerate mutase [Syntrophomonas zehnderi]CFX52414.1 Bisphosphoglycerate-independent phosphoglycerate mutase [Syntrophomonas zehnderi OL-4]